MRSKLTHLFSMFLLCGMVGGNANAGTITGTIHAEGKTGADDAQCGKYDSREFKFAERVNYAELHDFIVYIEGPVGTNTVIAPAKPAQVITSRVQQKGAM